MTAHHHCSVTIMPMNPRLLRPTASGATHPDARDWATRVTANGGSVSSSTLRAVDTFCRAIDAAGIRDRFYRLNLFCGNSDASLNAVRTPLYLADAPGGSNFGGAIDTNTNFVAGDYTETGGSGGLTGNASNKLLNTGFVPSSITFSDSHISVYGDDLCTGGASFLDHGSRGASSNGRFELRMRSIDPVNGFAANGGSANNVIASIAQGAIESGHVLGTSTASTDHRMFANGNQIRSDATSRTGPLSAVSWALFALNNNGSLVGYYSSTLSAYSIGKGMTPTQAAAYYTALHAFQTTLGRNK